MKLTDLIEILSAISYDPDIEVDFESITFPKLNVCLTPYEKYVEKVENKVYNKEYYTVGFQNTFSTMNDTGPVSSNDVCCSGSGSDCLSEIKVNHKKEKHQCHRHHWKEK